MRGSSRSVRRGIGTAALQLFAVSWPHHWPQQIGRGSKIGCWPAKATNFVAPAGARRRPPLPSTPRSAAMVGGSPPRPEGWLKDSEGDHERGLEFSIAKRFVPEGRWERVHVARRIQEGSRCRQHGGVGLWKDTLMMWLRRGGRWKMRRTKHGSCPRIQARIASAPGTRRLLYESFLYRTFPLPIRRLYGRSTSDLAFA